MPSNLSFENLAAVLSALGATALLACAGQQPQPVNAREVSPVSSATPTTATMGPPAAATPAAMDPPAAATPAAMDPPAAATPATENVAVKPTAAQGTAKKVPVQKAAHGEASCGAGTCSNDTKKKIW